MKKRLLAVLICLAALLTILTVGALADDPVAVDSGSCGDSMTWVLDDTGTLTVSGSGPMTAYESCENTPWYASSSEIRIVILEEGVESISAEAFTNCTNMTFVRIPDSVTEIGARAFYNCTSLKSARIPDGVSILAESTFQNCSSLKYLMLGSGLTSIGTNAVNGCSGIERIFYAGTMEQWELIDYEYEEELDFPLYANEAVSGYCGDSVSWAMDALGQLFVVGCGEMYDFSDTTPWYEERAAMTVLIVEDGVTSIGSFAFINCNNLTYVTLADSVGSIGQYAFRNCVSLEKVRIPDGVASVPKGAFHNCSAMESVRIPASAASIEAAAFYNCTSLTDVYYGGSPIKWESVAISNDTGSNNSIVNAAMHYNVVDYGIAGDYDTDYTNVTWVMDTFGTLTLSGSGSIGESATSNRWNFIPENYPIRNVVIENGISRINYKSFDSLPELTSVTIPSSVTTINSYAFENSSNLADVYYTGTESEWDSITIYEPDDELLSATVHFQCRGGLCGDSMTWMLDADGILTISGSGNMYNYRNTPAPWDDYRLNVKKIVIEDGVGSIGGYAFSGLSYAEAVSIPDSVTEIGAYAFSNCVSLEHVTIPEGVTKLQDAVFASCSALQWIYIPAGVTEIGDAAFAGCTCPPTVYYEGTEEQWNSIAIYNDDDQNAYIIYSSAKYYNVAGYGSCGSSLTWLLGTDGTLTISGTGDMESYVYAGSTPWYDQCDAIQNVVIENGVTSIGYGAFTDCSNLTAVTIPYGITVIYGCAFLNCSSLTDAYYTGSMYDWASLSVSYGNDDLLNAEMHYLSKEGSCGDSMTWALDDDGTLTISGTGVMEDFDEIDAPWAANSDAIKDIIIEDGVASIGAYAFSECSNLTHVRIPESVTTIGEYAFAGCTSLTSVRIPSQIAEIETGTFSDCTGLKTVTVGGVVVSVDYAAFDNCPNLYEVYYAGTKDEWDNIAFDEYNNRFQYSNLRNYNIISGNCGDNLIWRFNEYGMLTISGSGPMKNFLNAGDEPWHDHFVEIKTVLIEDGVTSIGNTAFYSYWHLSRVIIPDSVSLIGMNAFYQCSMLTEVKIPAGVTAIQADSFGACSSLTRIGIPDSVVGIVRGAFSGCTSLADVYYGGTEEQWNSINIDNIEELNTPVINAAKHYNVAAYGDCGKTSADDLTWILDTAGTLTISGTGNMRTCEADTAPWYDERADIKKVVIEYGVVSIGMDDFRECDNLTEVTIADSVESIGIGAFAFCDNLKTVTIPVSVTSIEHSAFAYSGLTDVYYAGTRAQWNAVTIEDYNDPLQNAAIHCSDDTGLYIVTQPDGGTATYGQTVYISFEAVNAASYQWYYSKDGGANWTKLYWDGARTDTLSVAYKASRSAFQYKCLVKGTDGTTLYTDPTSITLGTAPLVVINQQPQTVCADIGETVSFTIDADNAVTYQWYYSKDDGASWTKLYWDGYDSDTMTFEVKKSRYSYVYYCKMTDGNGNAYYSTRCYLRQHFQLKKQPQDVTAVIGDTVNLTVSAVGVQSYQWYYSKDGGENWTKLSWTGAKSDTLSVDVTKTRCSYVYHCVLVGYDGTEATTNTVKITAAG